MFVLCCVHSTIHDDEGFQGAQGAGSNCAVACQFGRNSDDPNDPCRNCGGYGKIVILSRFVCCYLANPKSITILFVVTFFF